MMPVAKELKCLVGPWHLNLSCCRLLLEKSIQQAGLTTFFVTPLQGRTSNTG
jgi:hypothetical protein